MSKDRYLAFTDLARAADVKLGTEVEVVIQSHGGKNKTSYTSRISSVKQTPQKGNEQVILVDNSGKKQVVGGGTSVRKK